jgi:hypothetical protein
MTKQPIQTTLVIPCTDDGGVGKTTDLVLIADYLKAKDQKLALFDCDISSAGKASSFAHWFGGQANHLDLRDEADLDSLLSRSAGCGVGWAIADLPANSSGDIADWLKTVATPKAIERLCLRIIAVGALNPTLGSCESVVQSMEMLGSRATYLIALNRTQYDRKIKSAETVFPLWFQWLKSYENKSVLHTIDVPHLQVRTIETLQAAGQLPSKTAKDPALDPVMRIRIENWLEEVHSQLDATGLFTPKTTETLVAAK